MGKGREEGAQESWSLQQALWKRAPHRLGRQGATGQERSSGRLEPVGISDPLLDFLKTETRHLGSFAQETVAKLE